MKEVLDFAKGKMPYEKFVEVLEEKPEVWAFLQGLVPRKYPHWVQEPEWPCTYTKGIVYAENRRLG